MMRITLACMQCSHTVMRIIILFTSLLFRRWLLRHCWSELALHSQLLAEEIEADRDRNAEEGETAEERGSPLDAEVVEHLAGEQWKACCGYRSKKGVACDRGGGTGVVSRAQRNERLVLTT